MVLKELSKKNPLLFGFLPKQVKPPSLPPKNVGTFSAIFLKSKLWIFRGNFVCSNSLNALGKKWPKSFGFGEPPPFFLKSPYTDVS